MDQKCGGYAASCCGAEEDYCIDRYFTKMTGFLFTNDGLA